MYILGIETSCDETSAAVVKDGRIVLSNPVSSSLKLHRKYGGIVPEIASRAQLETITQVTGLALKQAKLKLEDIALVSATVEPGLLGSLLVGISFAKALSLGLGVGFLGLNHLHSHLYSNFLSGQKPKLPFVGLVVSGGHTSLFYVPNFQKFDSIGQTQDDACGEAFDKVAKILGLGYPGGPLIEQLAKKGNPKKIKFNCSDTTCPLDFSFSGIKTAVLYYLRKRVSAQARRLDAREKADICASFQEAAFDALIHKSLLACKHKRVNRLVVGGGVAINNRLREKFYAAAKDHCLQCYFPPGKFCLDNAAMVAGLGYQLRSQAVAC
ncbi:MAG: tRNA (adenosine(37)-N6)-threonylcarbamoyltransferase complex transferase subunit TsaD [Candidatus Omnitrophota bacterium]